MLSFFFFLIISFPFQFHIPYFAHHLQTYLFMKGKKLSPLRYILYHSYDYNCNLQIYCSILCVTKKKLYIHYISTHFVIPKKGGKDGARYRHPRYCSYSRSRRDGRKKEKEDPWRVSLLCAIRCSILLYYFFT